MKKSKKKYVYSGKEELDNSSKFLDLPMKSYLLKVFSKCSYQKRNYIIFDQLNPSFSKYFRKKEIFEVMKKSGFKKIKIYRRHNYSWTIISQK